MVPVPRTVQVDATAYLPLRAAVSITPSMEVVVVPVNSPVDGSNFHCTRLAVGSPLVLVPEPKKPYAPAREEFEQVLAQAAELIARLAKTIIRARRSALKIIVLSFFVFCLRSSI